jgi:dolichol-phosphate mannosyltransferase
MASGDNSVGVDYSIVVPVYCNAGELKKLHSALLTDVVQKNPEKSYEIIFVDDGSPDGSLLELLQIKEEDSAHVKIIKFSRNFGQVPAIKAGYKLASGKCVVNISADLQDPPELINEMLAHFFEKGIEVVICHRIAREESVMRSLTSKISYKLIKKLSFPDMPEGGFDFVLLSARVRDVVLNLHEANPFWQAQILWSGFSRIFIPYERRKREIGKSKWTLAKKLKYLIDGIMGYSYTPIRLISLLGIILALFGLSYACYIFIARLTGNITITGWAPIAILILILSGMQMVMMGVIGEYLWRVFDQVRQRQPYIIEKIY